MSRHSSKKDFSLLKLKSSSVQVNKSSMLQSIPKFKASFEEVDTSDEEVEVVYLAVVSASIVLSCL